jgi:hypothetical protein
VGHVIRGASWGLYFIPGQGLPITEPEITSLWRALSLAQYGGMPSLADGTGEHALCKEIDNNGKCQQYSLLSYEKRLKRMLGVIGRKSLASKGVRPRS